MPLTQIEVLDGKRILNELRDAIFAAMSGDRVPPDNNLNNVQELLGVWEGFRSRTSERLQLADAQADDAARQRDRVCFALMDCAIAADLYRIEFRGGEALVGTPQAEWERRVRWHGLTGDADLAWRDISESQNSMIDAIGLVAAELAGPASIPDIELEDTMTEWEVDQHLRRIVDEMVRRCSQGVWASARHIAPISVLLESLSVPIATIDEALEKNWVRERIEQLLSRAREDAAALIAVGAWALRNPDLGTAFVPNATRGLSDALLRRLYGVPDLLTGVSRHLVGLTEDGRKTALSRAEALNREHKRWVGPAAHASWIIVPTLMLNPALPVHIAIGGIIIAWCLWVTGSMLDADIPLRGPWSGPQRIVTAVAN